MSTKSAISIEEYLRTSFEGLDREYVDGEIVERTLPNYLHSRTQCRLAGLIWHLGQTRPLYGTTELRSRVAPARIRIPDVCIYAGVEPTEEVPSEPPLVAIEILSPDDRLSGVLQKLKEYVDWGVQHIWLVDPKRHVLHIYAKNTLSEVSELTIPEFEVQLTGADIFG